MLRNRTLHPLFCKWILTGILCLNHQVRWWYFFIFYCLCMFTLNHQFSLCHSIKMSCKDFVKLAQTSWDQNLTPFLFVVTIKTVTPKLWFSQRWKLFWKHLFTKWMKSFVKKTTRSQKSRIASWKFCLKSNFSYYVFFDSLWNQTSQKLINICIFIKTL